MPSIENMDHYSFVALLDIFPDGLGVNPPDYDKRQLADTFPASRQRTCPSAVWQEHLLNALDEQLIKLKYPDKLCRPAFVGDKVYQSSNPDLLSTHSKLDSDFHR